MNWIDWKTPTTPSPGNVMHGTRTKTMSQRDDLNMGTDVAPIHYLFRSYCEPSI